MSKPALWCFVGAEDLARRLNDAGEPVLGLAATADSATVMSGVIRYVKHPQSAALVIDSGRLDLGEEVAAQRVPFAQLMIVTAVDIDLPQGFTAVHPDAMPADLLAQAEPQSRPAPAAAEPDAPQPQPSISNEPSVPDEFYETDVYESDEVEPSEALQYDELADAPQHAAPPAREAPSVIIMPPPTGGAASPDVPEIPGVSEDPGSSPAMPADMADLARHSMDVGQLADPLLERTHEESEESAPAFGTHVPDTSENGPASDITRVGERTSVEGTAEPSKSLPGGEDDDPFARLMKRASDAPSPAAAEPPAPSEVAPPPSEPIITPKIPQRPAEPAASTQEAPPPRPVAPPSEPPPAPSPALVEPSAVPVQQQPVQQQPPPDMPAPSVKPAAAGESALDPTFAGSPWFDQANPTAGPLGKTIGILASKGGIGKTTMAMWIAATMHSAENTRVCVIDANLDNRTLAYLTGNFQSNSGLAGLVGPQRPTSAQIDQVLVEVEGLGWLLPGPQYPTRLKLDSVAQTLGHVLHYLRRQFDYVFVDLPVAGTETKMLTEFALREGMLDLYVCVFNTEQSDVMTCSSWLWEQSKPPHEGGSSLDLKKCVGLINRCDATDMNSDWLQLMIKKNLGIPVAGHIPDVPDLGTARNKLMWQCPRSVQPHVADFCYNAFRVNLGTTETERTDERWKPPWRRRRKARSIR